MHEMSFTVELWKEIRVNRLKKMHSFIAQWYFLIKIILNCKIYIFEDFS